MATGLQFYTHPMSRGRIVRWMLEEVGEPYETEILDFATTMKSERYLAINPMGKVPAIRHGDTVVTECAAICAYLADAFPAAGLAPAPGSSDRGPYYRWLFFAAGPLEAAVVNKALKFEVPPDKQGMAGFGSLERVLDTLESHLSARQFVAGDRFSAADLYLGAQLNWGMMFGTIDKRPAFQAYGGALAQRPAFARADAIDNAAMPKKSG